MNHPSKAVSAVAAAIAAATLSFLAAPRPAAAVDLIDVDTDGILTPPDSPPDAPSSAKQVEIRIKKVAFFDVCDFENFRDTRKCEPHVKVESTTLNCNGQSANSDGIVADCMSVTVRDRAGFMLALYDADGGAGGDDHIDISPTGSHDVLINVGNEGGWSTADLNGHNPQCDGVAWGSYCTLHEPNEGSPDRGGLEIRIDLVNNSSATVRSPQPAHV